MKTTARLRRDSGRLSVLQQIKRSRESYLLLAPFMLLFLLLTVIPMVSAIGLSFTNFNMLEAPRFVGWQNYQRMLLGDPTFYKVVGNTLVFAFLTGPISYVLSFLFAWLINETGRALRTFLTAVFYMPVLAGNIYFVWAFLLSSDSYGVINGLHYPGADRLAGGSKLDDGIPDRGTALDEPRHRIPCLYRGVPEYG